MIDIFSMIVIFLIKGAVFGASDIAIPENVRLPASVSKENVEPAPQLLISGGQVKTNVYPRAIPLEYFHNSQASDLQVLKEQLRAFIQRQGNPEKRSQIQLHVIADRSTPYRDIFDTVKVFRESGFESVLFLATGPEGGAIEKK